MGFLSQVAPSDVDGEQEDGNETFYGTAIAGQDVNPYEMREDDVRMHHVEQIQVVLIHSRCPHAMRIDTSRTNVSDHRSSFGQVGWMVL